MSREKELEIELAFAERQVALLGTSRQRMMRRTAQASMQRDQVMQVVREAVAARDWAPLLQLLDEVRRAHGLWSPMCNTERAQTYQDWRP